MTPDRPSLAGGMPDAKHIGIAAVSAEGAALCYRTICTEGAAILGRHAHPQVSMHTYPLSQYMHHVDAGRWEDAGRLLLRSAQILVDGSQPSLAGVASGLSAIPTTGIGCGT